MSLELLQRELARPNRTGEVRRITSVTNDLIKAIRSLELKKNRQESGLFVAEGARTLIEAQELGADLKAIIYLDQAAHAPHLTRIRTKLTHTGGLCLEVSQDVLEKLSHRNNPQTVIGVFTQKWQALDADLAKNSHLLALEQVRDPGNLGTILRSCDALSYKGVILIGDCTDPYALDAVRASMGSIFAVQLARCSLDAFLAWRKTYQGQVIGTHLAGATDLRQHNWPQQRLIVMGNEQQGLSDAMAQTCDTLVKIPMSGRADSLNLAIATGITLFESVRDGSDLSLSTQ